MPFDWQIFLKVLLALLRVLQQLPKDSDHTEVTGLMADAIEANGIGPEKPE